jgi:hypothetical protein
MCWKQRFWAKVNKTDKCWIWQAARSSRLDDQYGKIKIGGKVYRSHRVAYAISNSLELTFKGHVLHSCDNPLCCNPEHLSLGTHKQNMEQMKLRGRAGKTDQRGAKNHNSKLRDSDIIKIKELINQKLPNKKIAAMFGVAHQTISCIKRGTTW